MELDELIPERVEWSPEYRDDKGDSQSVTFHFREFSIEDESWLRRTYGDKRVQEIFGKLEMSELAKIGYRQLDMDSKKRLMQMKFEDMDEDGNIVEIATKGPDKLGFLTIGYPAQAKLVEMLLRTRGFSMPVIEELGEKLLEQQKKAAMT